MNVHERQNSQWALDRLVAQRLLYRQVKTVENWRLALLAFVAALLLWGLIAEEGSFLQVATTVVVFLWFLDQVVLVRYTGRMKEEAAAIQEDFDCFVLDIPWPEHGGLERPTEDRVRELARKGRETPTVGERVTDWYGGDDIPVDALAARLHCQRFNCWWDGRLRREWICLMGSAVLLLGSREYCGIGALRGFGAPSSVGRGSGAQACRVAAHGISGSRDREKTHGEAASVPVAFGCRGNPDYRVRRSPRARQRSSSIGVPVRRCRTGSTDSGGTPTKR